MWHYGFYHRGYYHGMPRPGGGVRFASGIRFGRRFLTREERIARLEEYLKALQTEAKAVEEHIAELKASGQEKAEG